MNKLDPVLKKLMSIANRVEEPPEMDAESIPPRDLVMRLLHETTPVLNLPPPSLLEFMVPRGAAIAAIVGIVTLTVQLSAGGPFLGMWNGALSHGAELLRVFLP